MVVVGVRYGRREDKGIVERVERVIEDRIDSPGGSTVLYNVENKNKRMYA